MATVEPPRRVPLARAASASADPAQSCLINRGGNSVLRDGPDQTKAAIKRFLFEHSSSATLRRCGSTRIREHEIWNSCESPLCWTCAPRRANVLSADLAARSTDAASLLTMRLSLATDPSQTLAEAWDALDAVRASWSAGRAVLKRVAEYRWFTEVTHNADTGNWNPHLHLILGTTQKMNRAEAQTIIDALVARWVSCAARLGRTATQEALHGDLIDRTPARAIRYASKGVMGGHSAADGYARTPGDILLSAALMGDADDAELWAEIESAAARRRFQGTGGTWRGQPKT